MVEGKNDMSNDGGLAGLISAKHQEIIEDWVKRQMSVLSARGSAKEGELRAQCESFLSEFEKGVAAGAGFDAAGSSYERMRSMLDELSRSRAQQGFSPGETAIFVLSLRQSLFEALGVEPLAKSPAAFWEMNLLLDNLALSTVDAYLSGREEIISRQQSELLELSTPVVELWEGILALPLIGTLDSNRTQVVMESLLQKIVETGAPFAIIDITGVPYVDTLVAQHLLKTIAAARLMGADCIISGIRPQIAQTIVHLGVELQDVVTKATLSDAFALALSRVGARVVKEGQRS